MVCQIIFLWTLVLYILSFECYFFLRRVRFDLYITRRPQYLQISTSFDVMSKCFKYSDSDCIWIPCHTDPTAHVLSSPGRLGFSCVLTPTFSTLELFDLYHKKQKNAILSDMHIFLYIPSFKSNGVCLQCWKVVFKCTNSIWTCMYF